MGWRVKVKDFGYGVWMGAGFTVKGLGFRV